MQTVTCRDYFYETFSSQSRLYIWIFAQNGRCLISNTCSWAQRGWTWWCFMFGFMQLWGWLPNENKQIILSFITELKSQTDADWGSTYLALWWDQNMFCRWLKIFLKFKPFVGILEQISENCFWFGCSDFYVKALLVQQPVRWQQHPKFSVSRSLNPQPFDIYYKLWMGHESWLCNYSYISFSRCFMHTYCKSSIFLLDKEYWSDQMASNTIEGLITGRQQRMSLQCWKRGCEQEEEESRRGLEKWSRWEIWTWNPELNCGKSCVTRARVCFTSSKHVPLHAGKAYWCVVHTPVPSGSQFGGTDPSWILREKRRRSERVSKCIFTLPT